MTRSAFTVVLTGGIGAGKSLAANLFAKLGIAIIDADVIAKQCLTAPSPLIGKLLDRFGEHLLIDGQLDRRTLRKIIFTDPIAKSDLEALLHPEISKQIAKQRQHMTAPYTMLVIPLLKCRDQYPDIDRILLVDCSESTQIQRAMQRDNCDRELIQAIIKQQPSRKLRQSLADDMIINDKDPAFLQQQVTRLHQHYLRFAQF